MRSFVVARDCIKSFLMTRQRMLTANSYRIPKDVLAEAKALVCDEDRVFFVGRFACSEAARTRRGDCSSRHLALHRAQDSFCRMRSFVAANMLAKVGLKDFVHTRERDIKTGQMHSLIVVRLPNGAVMQ